MNNNDRIRKVLADNIRRIRKSQNLTQAKLAELTNISNTYIANIECGKTWISDTTLERLARAFGICEYELFLPSQKEGIVTSAILNNVLISKKKKLTEDILHLISCAMKEIQEEIINE